MWSAGEQSAEEEYDEAVGPSADPSPQQMRKRRPRSHRRQQRVPSSPPVAPLGQDSCFWSAAQPQDQKAREPPDHQQDSAEKRQQAYEAHLS